MCRVRVTGLSFVSSRSEDLNLAEAAALSTSQRQGKHNKHIQTDICACTAYICISAHFLEGAAGGETEK